MHSWTSVDQNRFCALLGGHVNSVDGISVFRLRRIHTWIPWMQTGIFVRVFISVPAYKRVLFRSLFGRKIIIKWLERTWTRLRVAYYANLPRQNTAGFICLEGIWRWSDRQHPTIALTIPLRVSWCKLGRRCRDGEDQKTSSVVCDNRKRLP